MDKSNTNRASLVNEYNNFCNTHGLSQIIKLYTHVNKTSSSIIDHILTNLYDRISQSGVIETAFSDHYPFFVPGKSPEINTTNIKLSK